MTTYNEILTAMKNAFFESSGENVSHLSDFEERLKAVASEIFSLSCYGDYILKQAFAQSATGEYLEKHAALRGITRKTAASAAGELVFSLDEALDEDVQIPAGTVCSCADDIYIQFATDSDAVISAGETSAAVGATALGSGKEYNALPGTVTVMVNPPEYVSGVTNESAFSGGTDDESDSSLRERLISSYSAVNNCVNEKSVRELLLTLEEITDALPRIGDNGELNVFLKTKSGEISEELKTQVEELLYFAAICGVQINCEEAAAKSFNVAISVNVLTGYDEESVLSAVKDAAVQFCAGEKIGKSLNSSALASAVYPCDGVKFADIVLAGSTAGTLSCGTGEYLVLGDISVVANGE
ncbi:MAG: baseplate J/gp47 family protein [Clostridiales bacterium]|nr:baseplate J/gp47 family protein [Clostridiales bacterium]